MAQRPGILRTIWNNFVNSLSSKTTRTVVGKDHFGNVYYVEKGASDRRKAVHRGYLPGSAMTWQNLPVEWEAWLRGRRQEAPTQEEIDRNLKHTEEIKRRAAELEAKYQDEKLALKESEEKDFAAVDRLRRANIPTIKSGYTGGGGGGGGKEGEKAAFPKYEEFEDIPGSKYDPREKPPQK